MSSQHNFKKDERVSVNVWGTGERHGRVVYTPRSGSMKVGVVLDGNSPYSIYYYHVDFITKEEI